MKKSKDITKYDVDWQVLRAKIKGPKVDLISKLRQVNDFWKDNQTKDNWERIVNWLEGLRMGYIASKDTNALDLIDKQVAWYRKQQPSSKENILSDTDQINKIQQYTFDQRYGLWKDLYNRNKKWLSKGYFHKEHNHFMDLLWKVFRANNEISRVSSNYSYDNILKMRKASKNIKNTHKFFF